MDAPDLVTAAHVFQGRVVVEKDARSAEAIASKISSFSPSRPGRGNL